VRVEAPDLASALAANGATANPETARRLFRQVLAVSLSAQLPTTTASELRIVGCQGAAARTREEMRAAFAHAAAFFGVWQRNDAHEEMHDDDAGFGDEVRFSGSYEHPQYGRVLVFVRGPGEPMIDGQTCTKTVFVDATRGLPMAEEVKDQAGQTISQTEYSDFGADVVVEIPGRLQ